MPQHAVIPRLRALFAEERFRQWFALGVAFLWFGVIMASSPWESPVLKLLLATPAVLVFVWWRRKPWLALGLSVAALCIALIGNGPSGDIGGTAIVACATGWLAVLGASLSEDTRARLGGVALVGVEALLALGSGGFGGFGGFVLILVLGGIPILTGWLWRRRSVEQSLSAQLAESTERGAAAEQDVLVELERNRLAREVHDVVAHSLAVVIAQADGARFAAETRPETVVPALEAISDTARRALGEVRTMLHDLRTSGEGGVTPGAADLTGLVEGVRGLGVAVNEVVFGEPQPLDRAPGLALYRIAQGALTNAMRHGDRAEPVGFELDWGERQVVPVILNAVPDEAVPASERAGHGVTGMRERAADAGGDCSAGVGSNGRFRVRVTLPVSAPAEPAPEEQPARHPLLALFGDEVTARG